MIGNGRSWVEIDLNVIEKNYLEYKKQLKSNQFLCAVVKADAYGHGAVPVSKKLQQAGCNFFAVATVDEAIELRKSGITGEILVLGYTPIERINEILEYDIIQTLIDEEYAKALPDIHIKAQFAIDTGMNRIGLNADNPDECEQIIKKYSNKFKINGIYTHLCVADTDSFDSFTNDQIKKFDNLCSKIKGMNLEYVHCLNSAGGLRYNKFGNLVRLGIVLYGLLPSNDVVLPDGIKPALSWKSRIIMVKKIKKGECVGYGCTYRADKDIKVATVCTGYADGYNRKNSNKGTVIINGCKVPVIGRVCMDQIMIDVSKINEVSAGDTVTLLGDGFTADDMAHICDTIGYETVCAISKRVPRYYL